MRTGRALAATCTKKGDRGGGGRDVLEVDVVDNNGSSVKGREGEERGNCVSLIRLGRMTLLRGRRNVFIS
jgi:hypothetical protein